MITLKEYIAAAGHLLLADYGTVIFATVSSGTSSNCGFAGSTSKKTRYDGPIAKGKSEKHEEACRILRRAATQGRPYSRVADVGKPHTWSRLRSQTRHSDSPKRFSKKSTGGPVWPPAARFDRLGEMMARNLVESSGGRPRGAAHTSGRS